jgi:hypothetical protein
MTHFSPLIVIHVVESCAYLKSLEVRLSSDVFCSLVWMYAQNFEINIHFIDMKPN